MEAHTCNPSTREGEAGGLLSSRQPEYGDPVYKVGGESGLYIKTLLRKKEKVKKKCTSSLLQDLKANFFLFQKAFARMLKLLFLASTLLKTKSTCIVGKPDKMVSFKTSMT